MANRYVDTSDNTVVGALQWRGTNWLEMLARFGEDVVALVNDKLFLVAGDTNTEVPLEAWVIEDERKNFWLSPDDEFHEGFVEVSEDENPLD